MQAATRCRCNNRSDTGFTGLEAERWLSSQHCSSVYVEDLSGDEAGMLRA